MFDDIECSPPFSRPQARRQIFETIASQEKVLRDLIAARTAARDLDRDAALAMVCAARDLEYPIRDCSSDLREDLDAAIGRQLDAHLEMAILIVGEALVLLKSAQASLVLLYDLRENLDASWHNFDVWELSRSLIQRAAAVPGLPIGWKAGGA